MISETKKNQSNKRVIRNTSPFITTSVTTTKVMLGVIISLLPPMIASVLIFGLRAILVIIISVFSSVLFEFFFNLVLKKEQTITDLSAIITGIILSMTYPVTISIPIIFIGSFVAIIVTKMLFGGLGHNFANPAAVGRVFLLLSFSSQMASWVNPEKYKAAGITTASATPIIAKSESVLDLFLGNVGGSLGETSAIAIIIGLIMLLGMGLVKPHTPIAYMGTVALFGFLLKYNPLEYIFLGGVMFGAVYMATDYSTTPYTSFGKIVFGVGCGFLNVLIREFGGYPEGTALSILLMNLVTPWIEVWTRPEQFGSKTNYKKRRMWVYIFIGFIIISMAIISVVNGA